MKSFVKKLQQPMERDEMQEHVLATYFGLRYGIAAVGIALPVVLVLGGKFWASLDLLDASGLPWLNSMSAYYHATGIEGRSMRDWFVGALFAVGVALYLYKGFSRAENYLLNAAGVLAVGVAVFPMGWPETAKGPLFSLHGLCAIGFFVCIALVALCCAKTTFKLIKDKQERKRLERIYRGLGVLMILSMVVAYVFSTAIGDAAWKFYVEVFGILTFVLYWWFKSRELGKTRAQAKALQKELRKPDGVVELA